MNFGWESAEEKLLRYMNIPAKKKMEWLQKMHELTVAAATPEKRDIFWKLRGIK